MLLNSYTYYNFSSFKFKRALPVLHLICRVYSYNNKRDVYNITFKRIQPFYSILYDCNFILFRLILAQK